METKPFSGTEDALTEKIIGVFYQVFNELGYGFAELVYRKAMAIALSQSRLNVAMEVSVPVTFRDEVVGVFRCDLMVERKVILELKIADQISKAFEAQLLHYLKASPVEVGLILSFGQAPKFRRMEFRNDRKRAATVNAPIPPFSL
jgi:GxxExxY protein